MIYRALTVKQPWASLLVAGIKTIENRSWSTNYRGPLAIHAGQGVERNARRMIERSLGRKLTDDEIEQYRLNERLPAGLVVGLVELVDVVRLDEVPVLRSCYNTQPWAIGPYCWLVRPMQQFTPSDCCETPGRLGLWKWDTEGGALPSYSSVG